MTGAKTRGEAVATARAAFTAAGLDSPALDARLLVAHALGVDALHLVTEATLPLKASEEARINALVARRLQREPVSRILGERGFYGRSFKLNPATLDPRPDSETLVEAVLTFVRAAGAASAPLRLLDVGTGTGCLLLSLLAELPAATGVGVDISTEALAMAATNATALGIGPDRVTWKLGSGFAPVAGTFNVTLSNPPYIPTADIVGLDPEVRLYDPLAALDGGADGLDFYRVWSVSACAHADKSLAIIIFEVGQGQAAVVAQMLAAAAPDAGWQIETFTDLAQIDRCVALSTRPAPV